MERDTAVMLIRREVAGDTHAVRAVHGAAFPAPAGAAPAEVALVDALRRSPAWIPRLSLVAAVGARVVGHVVCTRATLDGSHAVVGLGPLGVLPDRQGAGVGSALVHAVLGAADALDEPLVGVLGEPGYYGRFGFVPAAQVGVEAPEPSWGAHFQVRRLTAHRPDMAGPFRYAPPFDAVAAEAT